MREKSIKNVLEVLQRLLHVQKTLQGDTVEHKVVTNLPWTDSYEKISQKYFQLKIVIIRRFFWSLKLEEWIKNVLEALQRLIHIEKTLQRLTIQWCQIVQDADSIEETHCLSEQQSFNQSINQSVY